MSIEFSVDDLRYMQRAITLAKQGLYSAKPNPAVGCVLVKNGQIIAEGWHKQAGLPHAERVALADAAAKGVDVSGSTAYVTLEPCSHFGRTPPCADGLVEAKVSRVVIAMQDPNPLVSGQGIAKIQKACIDVQVGLCEEEARALNPGFIQMMEKKRPFVRVKMASSLDGRSAMASGESQWITGADSRQEVHRMRARSGAIVTGIGTVLADDPSLTVRLDDAVLADLNLDSKTCHPIRVVLDPNLSMPLDAKMLSAPGRTILMTKKETVDRDRGLADSLIANGVEVVAVAAQDDRLDIESVLHYLAEVESVNEVMVESGAMVAGAFIQSGLVNEVHCFIAPVLMGDRAKPMFALPGIDTMADKLKFEIVSTDLFGQDIRLILKPVSELNPVN